MNFFRKSPGANDTQIPRELLTLFIQNGAVQMTRKTFFCNQEVYKSGLYRVCPTNRRPLMQVSKGTPSLRLTRNFNSPSNLQTARDRLLHQSCLLPQKMAHSHAAPWKSEFTAHVGKMKSPEFVLSTIAPAPAGSFSSASYQPRARYCVFRGMWAELPANEKNPAERNPAIYESDCLTLTTDVRMQKVGELFASASSGATGREAPSAEGSGGGGPVEAVWWVKEDGIMTQWRVKGDAFVLAPDVEKSPESEGIRLLKKEVGERMKCKDEKREGEWSWARELTAHFGNQSPVIRGTHLPFPSDHGNLS